MTKEQLTHLFERANEQVELLRTHKYEFIDSHLDNIEREMHEFGLKGQICSWKGCFNQLNFN